jgi:hypothetical protein
LNKKHQSWWLAPLAVSLLFDIVVGIHAWTIYGREYVPASLLLAIAAGVIGTALGFLFGIPRALSAGELATAGASGRLVRQRYAINTNLEQISDWLTKAILAITLLEVRQIRSLAGQSAELLAPLATGRSDEGAKGFVIVVGTTFILTGFLGAYLWTRVYLTKEFRRSDDEALESPEYFEGLMNACLYVLPNGYMRTVQIAEEYTAIYGDNLTGRMCLYLACAHAQSYSSLLNRSGADQDLQSEKTKVLKYAELAMRLEPGNRGLIRQLWKPGENDDPAGDFVVFKGDPEFCALMKQFISE